MFAQVCEADASTEPVAWHMDMTVGTRDKARDFSPHTVSVW